MERHASEACYDLIASEEACRLVAYRDCADPPVWTIGYGHTEGVKEGDTCTPETARAWLAKDIAVAEAVVNKWVLVELAQHQFDALVSFVYNLGPGAPAVNGKGGKDGFVWLRQRGPYGTPRHSTMLRLINERRFDEAALEFAKWTLAGKARPANLVKRREREAKMFRGETA